HGPALREEMTTRARCSAMRSAMALPMPRDEPVMIATLPDNENSVMYLSPEAITAKCFHAGKDTVLFSSDTERVPALLMSIVQDLYHTACLAKSSKRPCSQVITGLQSDARRFRWYPRRRAD